MEQTDAVYFISSLIRQRNRTISSNRLDAHNRYKSTWDDKGAHRDKMQGSQQGEGLAIGNLPK
jgi:hypothetical protein